MSKSVNATTHHHLISHEDQRQCRHKEQILTSLTNLSLAYDTVLFNSVNEPPHEKNQQNGMFAQQRLRSAWASAQSD